MTNRRDQKVASNYISMAPPTPSIIDDWRAYLKTVSREFFKSATLLASIFESDSSLFSL